MTDEEARYDDIAEAYARWWSPVHRPATLSLLDEVAGQVDGGVRRVLDVGAGTGAMAAAAVERWAAIEVDGIDASQGMLEIATREAGRLAPAARDRLRFHHAGADRLPFSDATFDLALSAFVLQLVPSRYRALREIRRVLRPGGRIAYVTWLRGGSPFGADEAYDEAREAAGLEPREGGGGHDDVASPEAAVRQLRRAGFTGATARGDRLVAPFTPEGYVGFVSQFDDEDEWASLGSGRRARLEADLLARLRARPPEDLELVLPIVYATATRPPDGR
jgi:SAM-dependent methyltransferase